MMTNYKVACKMYNELLFIAQGWYSPKKLAHAIRVAVYAFEDALTRENVNPYDVMIVGLAHDLLEDTKIDPSILETCIGNTLMSSVLTLSKDDNETYQHYIDNILMNKDNDPIAFIVKKADMKDHMTQTNTLTDKLRDKYLPVLHYFL